jgi:glutamine synthetase
MTTSAMLNTDELRAAVAVGEIDTVIVAFTDPYGRLLGKRFDAEFFCDSVDDGTHACDYLLTADMDMEPVAGYRYASWELGYGDFHLVPDLTTLRHAGWTDHAAFVLCDVVDDDAHRRVAVAPRSILRDQVERLAASGYTAMAASELEFFLYDDTYREAHAKGYSNLQPAGWYVEDYHLLQASRVEPYVRAARKALVASGVPVENSKGEWGRGQHELNIRYAEILDMADRHTIMKHAMKELADSTGISLTFMAKPSSDEAGSSSHIHLSLWDATATTNVFDSDGTDSDVFRWFLGGWMKYLPDFMVCYAPTVNSYKRYVDGSWAPTRIAWSRDNRTAGFRVVGAGSALRIENRIPGADCNPYLAYAASIASGLAGIEQRIEPPARFEGDVYQAEDLPRVPYTLEQAIAAFSTSAIARSAFGDEAVDHYTHFHQVEVGAFNAFVTDWERSRYFERI